MEKYCTPEFEFKKVLILSNVTVFIICVLITWPSIILYALKGYRYLGIGGMSLLMGVFFMIFSVLFNYLSKTVTIYFDRKRMYVKDGDKEYTGYLKRDILGFYSYNYDERSSSFITIKIIFKNGKVINITDANISSKKDADKELMLKQFLLTAKRQLEFTFIKKNRRRSLLKIGAHWYSRDPNEKDSNANEADIV
ncbi:hypothetical protein MUGA111182_14705 [Mucilaginibacter galii]|uniref:PH domain-containing protein n=1 Tax=Mucilaginibacter galii TaxID=2005073 RepID=A0A917J8I7_9SPHI|nr:hypothetical protein [Mucilaginibacter galii]GGI50082.1 hypothetical protein GCM10011425_12940 [Mucilaginibacter galii]